MVDTEVQIILAKNEFEIIMSYLRGGLGRTTFNRQEAQELEAELKRAKLVDGSELPSDVVRLNSLVTVRDEANGKTMEIKIVTPEHADIRQRKISVVSPIGTALLGFPKGQQISWKVPAGKKVFTILDVQNPA